MRTISIGFAFALSNALLSVVPYFIGQLIGSLGDSNSTTHSSLTYVVILIALSSVHDVTWRASEFLYLKYILPLSFDYETRIFNHVIQKQYMYFTEKFTGKISSYISTISQEFRSLLDSVYFSYVGEFVSLVIIIGVLTTVNAMTAILFVIGLSLMMVGGYFTIGYSNRTEKQFTDVQSTKNSRMIDSISNFVNIKSFHSEFKELLEFKDLQKTTYKANHKAFVAGIIFWGVMSFFIRQFIWPVTILYNYNLFMHHQISLAQFATLLTTILLFSNFIWEIVWNISQLNLRLARLEESHNYLFKNERFLFTDIASSKPLAPPFTSTLQLKDLTFAYPDKPDKLVLKKLDLTIKAGEKIGIVGHSGSGKSTITKLLLGYYELVDSELLIDGKPQTGKALAQLISFVPQDTGLFHRTIAENIAYATSRKVTHDEIVVAAKRAQAHEFIMNIDNNYEALVGERGVKLSAGQRQRIAIARAYLDDKPILILDEATSALDSESEVLIQQALEALWQDKTVIAIAHRLSTLRNMDRIIVIDSGEIVEQGSHKELLKFKGLYAKLWGHQTGGFIDE